MRVIATVGLAGSGKGEVAAVASDLGYPVVTMGDVIRAACRDRGLDPATHHGAVASALREEDGPAAIAERSLPLITERLAAAEGETILVDGIRSGTEVDHFEEAFDEAFVLVSIEAPFGVRRERVADRGRDTVGADGESLDERDARERSFGMDDAIARADIRIENTDSLASFRDRIETLLCGEGEPPTETSSG
jgi:dephospho-CoA kinase